MTFNFLAIFDAGMTKSVTVFKFELQNLKQNEQYTGALEHKSCQESQNSSKQNRKSMPVMEKAKMFSWKCCQ